VEVTHLRNHLDWVRKLGKLLRIEYPPVGTFSPFTDVTTAKLFFYTRATQERHNLLVYLSRIVMRSQLLYCSWLSSSVKNVSLIPSVGLEPNCRLGTFSAMLLAKLPFHGSHASKRDTTCLCSSLARISLRCYRYDVHAWCMVNG